MTLVDSNVVIYAADPTSTFCHWAKETISNAVGNNGAIVNPIVVAEVLVGATHPSLVFQHLYDWGVDLVDLPAAAAEHCAGAYRRYRNARLAETGQQIGKIPLPDFFIGAHAEFMGWQLATADRGRFNTYFPSVTLITPH